MSNVIVIGAGPAGCMAAIMAKKNGHEVTIVEKNNNVGKKLSITGKGRCNITYNGDNEFFLENVVSNPKFLLSAINSFNNENLIAYLNELNIETKLERGNRIFLKSDNAKELSDRLYKELKVKGINILFNTSVSDITIEDKKINGVKLNNGEIKSCDACIISTGGKSYSSTGSTGDGYKLAEKLGHDIVKIKAALVPVKCYEVDICKSIQGLTLKNVNIKIIDNENINKPIYTDFGELLFTHFGITGPIILSASSKINNVKNIEEKMQNKQIKCIIDLKPALNKEQLYKRLSRDFDKYLNKELKNGLIDLLPKSIIPVIIKRTGIEESKKINQITKHEKEKIVKEIKEFELTLRSLLSIDAGIVTAGGVNTKEINPKTMESKLVNNLYFAGEVIDVDAYTGGFNLQIAFSTGYVAGNNIR